MKMIKLREFFKSLMVGSVALPAIVTAKPTELSKPKFVPSVRKHETLDKFKNPHEAVINAGDYEYRIKVSVTDYFLLPLYDESGIVECWETNMYGEYVKCIAQCTIMERVITDSLRHKFDSNIMEDGKLTIEQFNSFIKKCCSEFENLVSLGQAKKVTEIHPHTTISI